MKITERSRVSGGFMNINEVYDMLGGEFREVCARLGGERMVEKFLRRFPEDPSYRNLTDARVAGDVDGAFLAAHTLKGIASTLGLAKLCSAASELTEELRPRKKMAEERYFTAVDEAYYCAVGAISSLT